ncbi:hypothetical protein Bca4012_088594 [Brassica carinata]
MESSVVVSFSLRKRKHSESHGIGLESIGLRGRFLETLRRRRLLLISLPLSLPFPQRISNFSDQIPFIFDGGAVCDLHLHLSQDAVPCHSRAKKKTVDPEEEDAKEKDYENSDEENGNHGVERYESSSSSVFDFSASHSARDSGLPSANDVFSQVLSWKQNLTLWGSMRESETILMHNLLKRMVESEYLLQPIQMQKKLQIS